jgi:amino acid transporter
LVGSFIAAALKGFGIDIGSWWIGIGVLSMLLAWWLSYRDMRFAGRLMLALEGLVIVVIIGLCFSILRQVHPGAELTAAAFTPSEDYKGWVGIGFGMVFCVLSFAGFEGAATLGEETRDPRRNIPIALLGTVLGSGLFFVFVSYCEVAGFGLEGVKDLARSEAPLNDLALKFASRPLAIGLDLAAAASCFSSVLGSLAAAGRVLFAIGRGGLSPALGRVDPRHGTPAVALGVTAVIILWCSWCGHPLRDRATTTAMSAPSPR